MKIQIFFILGIFLLTANASTASAQTSCLLYPSNSTSPSGYGASWDVLSPARELLVKSNCPNSETTSLTITVGKGNNAQYVWNTTHVYTGSGWQAYTLSGTDAGSGWLTGTGNKTITMPYQPFTERPLFFVGYVCSLSGSTWKCGCANASCATRGWQLQAFLGVDTGGGTGGNGSWDEGAFSPPPFYRTVKDTAAKLCYNPSNTRSLTPGTSSITQGGTASNPLVYIPSDAFTGGTLSINAPYVVLKGGVFNGTNIRINANNVRLTQNIFNGAHNAQIISTGYAARYARIDRNILNAGSSTSGEDIQINIADGTGTPYYHRIDHNLFTGGAPGDDGGLNVYLGLVNKQRESMSRTLVEKNYVDHSGRKYGFYLKSMENVIENNVIDEGESRSGVRHGGRNIYFQNHFKGNTGFFTFDFDNYFVANIAHGTRQGFWAGSGDCTFGSSDFACLPDETPPGANHGQAVRTKLWGNKFVEASDKFRIGYLEYSPRRTPSRCPEGSEISGNSKLAVGAEGCDTPDSQSVSPSVEPALIGLTKSMVGPNGESDYLCP